jgi:hypothetical protein
MKRIFLLGILVLLAGCGGGGGGSSSSTLTITGTIADVSTGGPPSPAAQVDAGTSATAVLTDASGDFTVTAPANASELRVDRRDGSSLFIFPLQNVSGTTYNAGVLWIGPAKVTVTGTALDSATGSPISGATVNLGGIIGTTNSSGVFSLTGVPYSSATASYFPSLPGIISDTGYISVQFTPGNASGATGTVSLGAYQMVSSAGSNPPSSPYNIWGRVTTLSASPGTTVTLNLNGTAYRTTTVGSSGTYYFWVPAGTYTVSFSQTGFTAPTESVTLTATNQVVEEDAVLTASP